MHIIIVRMAGREYLHCAVFILSNLFTCQGKPVTGIISVKATCHQLWHVAFSLIGLCEKTTIEGSTCSLHSSGALRGYTPCDGTASQSKRSTECPIFSENKSKGRGETTKNKKQRK